VSFVLDDEDMTDQRVTAFELDEDERRAVSGLDEAAEVRVTAGGTEITLPAEAGRAVKRLLHHLASGASVHLTTGDAEMTTQEAADILRLSRTYVIRLIDQGKLKGHLVGTHRRLKATDVLEYKARQDARLAGLAELTAIDEEVGLDY
jgi:excisionase family DNA binding protein